MAEHHGTPMLACAAPEVLIAAIADATESIRVGSGGVMLPHYSPLKVAETFSILAALHPGRIDLGEPPAWYLNIQEEPQVEIQIWGERFKARAGPDEKPGMWRTMTDVWADYDSYQEKTDREIPVVALERQ